MSDVAERFFVFLRSLLVRAFSAIKRASELPCVKVDLREIVFTGTLLPLRRSDNDNDEDARFTAFYSLPDIGRNIHHAAWWDYVITLLCRPLGLTRDSRGVSGPEDWSSGRTRRPIRARLRARFVCLVSASTARGV